MIDAGDPKAVRKWIAQRLLDEERRTRVVDDLCVFGLSREAATAEVAAAATSPYMGALLAHARRSRKIEQLLTMTNDLWERSDDSRALPERRALTEPEFRDEYYYRNRPVIVRGGARDWPAVGKWTPLYFKEHLGETPIEYMDGKRAYMRNRRKRTTMADFVDLVESTVASNEMYIVATNHSLRRNGLAPLRDDVRGLSFAPEMNLDSPDAARFWFGPRGTITPLHHDLMNVLFVQIYGKKAFILAPSWSPLHLYADETLMSAVDPVAVDVSRFPQAATLPWMRAEVGPGDVLFIPVGWWHWVYAMTTSISVGCGNFSVGGTFDEWNNHERSTT